MAGLCCERARWEQHAARLVTVIGTHRWRRAQTTVDYKSLLDKDPPNYHQDHRRDAFLLLTNAGKQIKDDRGVGDTW